MKLPAYVNPEKPSNALRKAIDEETGTAYTPDDPEDMEDLQREAWEAQQTDLTPEEIGARRDKFRRQLSAGEAFYQQAVATGQKRKGVIIKYSMEQALIYNNFAYVKAVDRMRHVPATIDEFMTEDEFLGGRVEVWDKLLPAVKKMNPDLMVGETPINHVLNGGATGTGKSTLGQINILYTMYFLTCFNAPQELFNTMNRFTPIVIMLQSVSEGITKRILYKPIRDMFLDMPYTQKFVQFDKQQEGTLLFHDRCELVPALATPQSILGQAIIAAIVDEVNFMARVEQSKRVAGPRGMGGYYDQANEVYSNLIRRRTSRFLTTGPSPGAIYVSSSVHYQDDFMEREMKEAIKRNYSTTQVLRYKQFDVQPVSNYPSKKWFRFLVGGNDYPPRILSMNDRREKDYPASGEVVEVPIELKARFEEDPDGAQRDILGIASTAINRFIVKTDAIVAAVARGKERGLDPWVERQNVILAEHGLPTVIPTMIPTDDRARWVHVDLGISKDAVGIAVVCVPEHIDIPMDPTDENSNNERLPIFDVELAISIKPDTQNHIDIGEVRNWIIRLSTMHGLNIGGVSYDGFQSTESVQMLNRAGIKSMVISLDKKPEPYIQFRRALYQGRVNMVDNEKARWELAELEYHATNDIIDHPPNNGSKDIADAIAGACYLASISRGIRSENAVTDSKGEDIRMMEVGGIKRPSVSHLRR